MSDRIRKRIRWGRVAGYSLAALVVIPVLLISGLLAVEWRYGCDNTPVIELIERIKSSDVKVNTVVNTLVSNNYVLVHDSTSENMRLLCRSKVYPVYGRMITLAAQSGVVTGMLINGKIAR